MIIDENIIDNSKKYTFLQKELARFINLIWENRNNINVEDLKLLEYLSNKSYDNPKLTKDQLYKIKKECESEAIEYIPEGKLSGYSNDVYIKSYVDIARLAYAQGKFDERTDKKYKHYR